MPKPLASRRLSDRPGSFAVVEHGRIRSLHLTLSYAERQAKRILEARKLDSEVHLEVWRVDLAGNHPAVIRGQLIEFWGVSKMWDSGEDEQE